MNTPDMSQYLDIFLDEGREQLALLETNILHMERGNQTVEMLQVLFRISRIRCADGPLRWLQKLAASRLKATCSFWIERRRHWQSFSTK